MEIHFPLVQTALHHSLLEKGVNGIAVPGSHSAPGAEMIGQLSSLKLENGVAGALPFDPGRAQACTQVGTFYRLSHVPQ